MLRIALSIIYLLLISPLVQAAEEPAGAEGVRVRDIAVVRDRVRVCKDDAFGDPATAIEKGDKPVSKFVEGLLAHVTPDVCVKFVALTLCSIDNDTLKEIEKKFLSKVSGTVETIDLANNFFNGEAAGVIGTILKYPKLKYLSLRGTPLALRHIQNVTRPLLAKGADLEDIRKLVFMDQSYVHKASTVIKTYRELVTEGVLHEDWATTHLGFYKQLKKYDRELKKVEDMHAISDEILKAPLTIETLTALLAMVKV